MEEGISARTRRTATDRRGGLPAGGSGDLFDAAGAAMAVVDAQGSVRGWSTGARRLLGYEPADVVGRSAADLLAETLPEAARRSAQMQENWAGEVTVRHRNGDRLQLELWAHPLFGGDGSVWWLLNARTLVRCSSSHDRTGSRDPAPGAFSGTGRRAGEGVVPVPDRLRRRGDDPILLDWAFTQSPLYLALYDTDLRLRRANAAACQTLGMDEDGVRGRFLAEVLPGSPMAEAITGQLCQVVVTGEPLLFEAYGQMPADPRERAVALSVSPVKDPSGRVRGVLTAGFDITEQYRARERLALLNEASTRIGSTLDVTRTAEELAGMAVPRLADFVSVDLLDAVLGGGEPASGPLSGSIVLRRTVHESVLDGCPEAVVGVGEVDTYPEFSLPARAVATGRPHLYRITDSDIAGWVAGSPVRAAGVRDFGFHSVMAVPLRARGTTLGVAVFARHRRPEPFEQDDMILAEELAARAAVSIDNARRYTRERATAVTLQRSLLPQRLPTRTAVQVASRYLPAGSGLGVGGDWYDVIPLSGARVALVVGDVVGHGIHAAAAMGRLRTAVRTLADVDLAPDELLTRLDDVVTRLGAEENASANGVGGDQPAGDAATSDIAATCLYAVYDPVSRICAVACAGHPPPAVVTPDGSVDFLDVPAGPPLGFGGLPFETVDIELPEGSLLVLYSDGLLKSQGRDLDTGLGELRRSLAAPASSLEAVCGSVLAALLPERPVDDVALLIARTRSLDADQVASWGLSADPAVVAQARAEASRQLAVWGLQEATFTTELVVSELVTNAIRHADIPIELRLILDGGLICEVSDASSTAPHLRRAQGFDEGGRGLFLVAQLTRRWGTRHTRSGKTIWAEQPLPVEQPVPAD